MNGNVPAICAWTWLSDQLWIYQLESMGESNTKPSICCGCHGWRMIALLPFRCFFLRYVFFF
ncbi:hypothetical protein DDZ16_20480 [Marinilabilia rubra]|uniref:Uncharacterized protein n=1 Tax=Marinilabilia rubra TaxID=2162893 RepID=A0A2U2B351_9BACT|nr:hypothetical protein DDZ16_20480 [Marinilabilia rubra]